MVKKAKTNIKELRVKEFKLDIKRIRRKDQRLFDIKDKINKKTPKEIFGDVAIFCFCLFEFHRSIEVLKDNAGKHYELFTCNCGDAGCDGWHKGIYVDIEGDDLIWLVDEKVKKPIKLKFNINQYQQAHDDLYKKLTELYGVEGEITFNRGDGRQLKGILRFFREGIYQDPIENVGKSKLINQKVGNIIMFLSLPFLLFMGYQYIIKGYSFSFVKFFGVVIVLLLIGSYFKWKKE